MKNSRMSRRLSRRQLLGTTVAGAAAAVASSFAPRISFAGSKTLKIGFLAPLTGDVAAWGKPGLDCCLIWADWSNAAGVLKIGGDSYQVEFVGYYN